MDIQRLRNLTTGILHTEIGHVYQDIEYFTGEQGVMTHMIPRAMQALEPILRARLQDDRFFQRVWDKDHTGEVDMPALTEEERKTFWDNYKAQPSPLEGKKVVEVVVDREKQA